MAMATVSTKNAVGTTVTFPVHLDAAGNDISTNSNDTSIATYSSGGTILVVNMAASLTDLVALRGSASKTVRVKKIIAQCGATTGATIAVRVQKHSTANTGGTLATTPDVVPFDSGDAAGTALPLVYTANPTVGTATTVGSRNLVTTALTLGQPGTVEFDFVKDAEHAIVLRGVAQEVALNFGGTTPGAGAVLSWQIIWTEESES